MKLLALLLCGLLATGASAQETPPNGYDTLIAAGKLILPGENGVPSAAEKLSPQENLRRQRLAVARNAPALKLLREALQQPIEVPLPTNYGDLGFANHGRVRELARLLRQESDVRLADGDFAGALDSRLTGLELGAVITRGAPHIGLLVGVAMEAVARRDFETVAAKLDATQIRAAFPRLRAIEARRAAPAETLRAEKQTTFNLTSSSFAEFFASDEGRKALTTPEGRNKVMVSEEEARELLALTPESLAAQISAVFDAAIAREVLPYPRAIKVEVPRGSNRLVQVATDLLRRESTRFVYERNRAENRLLEAALELRAIKLESGAYPATFAAPLDPFSDGQPLIYKRDGDKYRLYSIGPDGRDDGGTPIQTIETDRKSGAQTVTKRLTPDSRGDILAPVF